VEVIGVEVIGVESMRENWSCELREIFGSYGRCMLGERVVLTITLVDGWDSCVWEKRKINSSNTTFIEL
jgi:hypothetical protein